MHHNSLSESNNSSSEKHYLNTINWIKKKPKKHWFRNISIVLFLLGAASFYIFSEKTPEKRKEPINHNISSHTSESEPVGIQDFTEEDSSTAFQEMQKYKSYIDDLSKYVDRSELERDLFFIFTEYRPGRSEMYAIEDLFKIGAPAIPLLEKLIEERPLSNIYQFKPQLDSLMQDAKKEQKIPFIGPRHFTESFVRVQRNGNLEGKIELINASEEGLSLMLYNYTYSYFSKVESENYNFTNVAGGDYKLKVNSEIDFIVEPDSISFSPGNPVVIRNGTIIQSANKELKARKLPILFAGNINIITSYTPFSDTLNKILRKMEGVYALSNKGKEYSFYVKDGKFCSSIDSGGTNQLKLKLSNKVYDIEIELNGGMYTNYTNLGSEEISYLSSNEEVFYLYDAPSKITIATPFRQKYKTFRNGAVATLITIMSSMGKANQTITSEEELEKICRKDGRNVISGDELETLDFENVLPGVYFLEVLSEDEKETLLYEFRNEIVIFPKAIQKIKLNIEDFKASGVGPLDYGYHLSHTSYDDIKEKLKSRSKELVFQEASTMSLDLGEHYTKNFDIDNNNVAVHFFSPSYEIVESADSPQTIIRNLKSFENFTPSWIGFWFVRDKPALKSTLKVNGEEIEKIAYPFKDLDEDFEYQNIWTRVNGELWGGYTSKWGRPAYDPPTTINNKEFILEFWPSFFVRSGQYDPGFLRKKVGVFWGVKTTLTGIKLYKQKTPEVIVKYADGKIQIE